MNKNISECVFYLSLFCLILFPFGRLNAQTDIRISGAQAGFPVAIPQMCNGSNAVEAAKKIPETISKDLQISGLFKVLNPASYVETPGKCGGPESFAYSDWTVIGAEGVVKGNITVQNGQLQAELYLYDVLQQKAVIGKKYSALESESQKVAHKFANEILFYFTGERGVFGTQIAYVSAVGRFKELFVMDIDGSNQKQITSDRGLIFSPSWSPKGDQIVYTSYASKSPELYLAVPESGRITRITKRPGLEVGAEFTKDGSRLLSSASFDGVSKIVMFDLRGQILSTLAQSGSIDVSPSFSPDGSQIAFCSNRGGGPQVYTMDAGGGSVKRISFADSNYCTSPAWSPKGDKIAYVCRMGGFQIFMSDPNGGAAIQLTFNGDNEDPSWSPDGRFLAFSSTSLGGGSKSIGILSLLGGRPTRITESKGDSSQPAWSPIELE
jgi:TolB protein